MKQRVWLCMAGVAVVAACSPPAPLEQGVGFTNVRVPDYSVERARQGQLETPLRLSPENTGAPAPRTHGNGITQADLAAAGINTGTTVQVTDGWGTPIHRPTEEAAPPWLRPQPATANPAPPAPVPAADVTQAAPTLAPQLAPQFAPAGGSGAVQVAQAPAQPAEAPLSALRPGALTDQAYTTAPAPSSVQAAAPAQAPAQAPAAQSTGLQRLAQAITPGTRRGGSEPADIVAYALQTRNTVGSPVYRRGFASQARSTRACARFSGMDQAQQAFLEAGGPQRDRLGLDPDGDGFACAWSPEPFRAARQG